MLARPAGLCDPRIAAVGRGDYGPSQTNRPPVLRVGKADIRELPADAGVRNRPRRSAVGRLDDDRTPGGSITGYPSRVSIDKADGVEL